MSYFSNLVLPLFIFIIIMYAFFKRTDIFSEFIKGAKQGAVSTFNILPSLVALVVAIGIFRSSGALDMTIASLRPLTAFLHVPDEIVPLAVLRPLSGSGALSVFQSILKENGPDSFIGRVASIIQGSAETTFYTIAVYYGSLKISKSRHTAFCSLVGDMTGLLAGLWITRLFFS